MLTTDLRSTLYLQKNDKLRGMEVNQKSIAKGPNIYKKKHIYTCPGYANVGPNLDISLSSFLMEYCQQKASQTAFVISKNRIITSSAVHIHRPRVKDSLGIPAGPATGLSGLLFSRLSSRHQSNPLLSGPHMLCSCPDFLIPTDQQWSFKGPPHFPSRIRTSIFCK